MNDDFSFFIYDFESFGINPAQDRPAQFAGVRTDKDFNIIDKPIILYCKQTNDYLPSPEAVLVTGITPQECNEKGIPEPEFAERILQEFSRPNTCIMGYNNIRYDDELTRYLFYRNFFDAYEYSWKNGNSRWDLLDLVRACYALRPEGINWAFDDQNIPSFKLENLTKVNNIEHSNAHDAMADVYATIELAKLIKQKQPQLFNYHFNHRIKKNIINEKIYEKGHENALINIAELKPLVHVSGMLGNYRANCSWIAPLEWHPTNQNAIIVCDLDSNIDALLTEQAEKLRKNLYTKKSELEEIGELPVPLKLVHLNKSPFLAPPKTLSPTRAEQLGINRKRCLENLEKLRKSTTIRQKVVDIFNEKIIFKDDDIEAALYNGFFSRNDKSNMEILHSIIKTDPKKLAEHRLCFEDSRIEKLLFHFRARHFYKTMTRAEQVKWDKYRRQKLEKSLTQFEESIRRLAREHENNAENIKLLKDLYEYASKLCN
ncbi:exodeoxyribonuclease I [Seminibacterium arietis]|uniref:Exodeoxyribonuclease I n=1 Tax=Seminibacterium arietis TaxID=1173502 RepID=A0ABW3I8Q0_9PAST